MIKTGAKPMRKAALRALALAAALIFALSLLPAAALAGRTESGPRTKQGPKDRSGAQIGSVYHVDPPFTRDGLPVQRADIVPGVIDCMSSARSAVLIEAESCQKLLASNPDERLPMASTTKTMTALVVIENCSPDEVVTVSGDAVGVDGSSLYLAFGEQLTVRDLLYGLMLRSGNDCAVALAVHAGGSVEGFAKMMNERAESLGLQNTHFVTPNGLHDEEHYTTAFELALIGAAAMRHPLFREIVSTRYYQIHTSMRRITVQNKNSMLQNYDGCVGIKTGYTRQAGRCLLFAAERDGMLLIGCVLNCKPMFDVAPEMLDYGFRNYTVVRLAEKGAELGRVTVSGVGIPLVAASDVTVPLKKGASLSAELRAELIEGVTAPVFEGQVLGTARLYSGGVFLGETKLLAGESALPKGFRYYFDYLVRSFFFGG